MKYIYVLFLAFIITSCSSKGFNEEGIRKKLNAKHIQITDEEIRKARVSTSTLKFPIKLAVYLDFSEEDSRWRSDWDWFPEDEKLFLSMEKELRNLGIVSELIFIPDAAVHGWSFKAVRKAAARFQADAILLVNGIPFVDSYSNGWSAAYITLAGLWLAPGTTKDALFALEGSIWDVNTQHLYTNFQERGLFSIHKPLIYIRDTEVIQKAKEKGLKSFATRFSREIRKLAGYTDEQIDAQEKEKALKKQKALDEKIRKEKERIEKEKQQKQAEKENTKQPNKSSKKI